jgi:hypothetical protein
MSACKFGATCVDKRKSANDDTVQNYKIFKKV